MDQKQIQRKHFFIDKEFQLRFIIKFCLIVLASSVLVAVMSFVIFQNSTTVAIENTKVAVKTTGDFILPLLAGVLLIVTGISALTVIVLTLLVSHKIAGPLFRIKRELDYLREGDLTRNFRLRSDDQLQPLSKSLCEMTESLRQNHLELRDKIMILKDYLRDKNFTRTEDEKKMLNQFINEIEVSIGFYKV
jgi:methyl-accepting chemotaxis protein